MPVLWWVSEDPATETRMRCRTVHPHSTSWQCTKIPMLGCEKLNLTSEEWQQHVTHAVGFTNCILSHTIFCVSYDSHNKYFPIHY